MSAPAVNVNSYSHLIKIGWLERMKLIPPFSTAAKFARSNARPTQAEHIPFVGVYFLDESLGPDGDDNAAEPRFVHQLQLGLSYIIQNNDPDVAEDMLDAAHWSFMKMLHDPAWHTFSNGVRVEAIPSANVGRQYGNVGHNNETPIAEMRMEVTFRHRTFFAPIITDAFEVFHMTTVPRDPHAVDPIITILNLPQ